MGDQGKAGGGEPGSQQMGMEQYQQANGPSQVQVSMAMSQAQQLPTLAPAPPGHSQPMHGPGGPVMHNMSGPGGQPGQGPQMTMQPMGQPQFQVIQQPSFNPSGQYATFPQFATYNQQGQLVLQPAMLGGPGQQQGQVILSALPQKPGQPHMITSGQPQGANKPGIPGQPNYTITSTGMAPGQSTPQTFIMAPQMGGPNMTACPVSMPGQGPPQPGQVVHTSMGNKVGESKPGMPGGQPQLGPGQQQAQQPQFLLPPGMAYMQAGQQQILQNGQIIFRAPGPQDQPLMFSPTGQPGQPGPQPNQGPQLHQANLPPQANGQPMQPPGQMSMGGPNPAGVRPPNIPNGAPPGKTAISRAIAPLLPTVSQTAPRPSYQVNTPGQPSPKSKQKMSPRGMQGLGAGRPPSSKAIQGNNQNMKMMPRMSNPVLPQQPGSPINMPSGSPRPPMLVNSSSPGPNGIPIMTSGPPTLTPMMFPTQPTSVPPSLASTFSTSMPTFTNMTPKLTSHMTIPVSAPIMVPTSAVLPTPQVPPPPPSVPDQGPPTLTKEISGPPMPNLGPPQLNTAAPLQTTETPPQTTPAPLPPTKTLDTEPGLTPTPKAVVKPQVLTHVIDGHIIKESSQPFPVSPIKTPAIRRKSEKDDRAPVTTSTTTTTTTTNGNNGPVKRGPGRPPGSTNNKQTVPAPVEGKPIKNVAPTGGEPPEKRTKIGNISPEKPPVIESQPVSPLTNGNIIQPPPTVPCAPLSPKNNPLKWNVSQVCDFIKKLPGCSDYVEDFALQEIDGQALMLLQADHLMTAMSIKLGPALKICEQVKQLKDDLNKN